VSLFEYLLLFERQQRDTSTAVFDDTQVFGGRGFTGRIIHLIQITDFKALTFILAEFLPYAFLFALIIQFAFYYKRLNSNESFNTLYKHGMYFFITSFVYFVAVNVLALYTNYIDLFQNTYFLSGYYVVNYKTQLIKFAIFVVWGAVVSNINHAKVLITHAKVIDGDLMILSFAALASGVVLVSVDDLWLMVVVLDSLGLLLYISAITTRSVGATSAAAQYFIFGALSSALIMWGTASLFGSSRVVSISA